MFRTYRCEMLGNATVAIALDRHSDVNETVQRLVAQSIWHVLE
jgi:hypothetical protein